MADSGFGSSDKLLRESQAFAGLVPQENTMRTPGQPLLTVDISGPLSTEERRARIKQMTQNHLAFDKARQTQEKLVRVQLALRRMPGVTGADAAELAAQLQEVGELINQETAQLVNALVNVMIDQEETDKAIARMSIDANLSQARTDDQAQTINNLRAEVRMEREKRDQLEAEARLLLERFQGMSEELKRVRDELAGKRETENERRQQNNQYDECGEISEGVEGDDEGDGDDDKDESDDNNDNSDYDFEHEFILSGGSISRRSTNQQRVKMPGLAEVLGHFERGMPTSPPAWIHPPQFQRQQSERERKRVEQIAAASRHLVQKALAEAARATVPRDTNGNNHKNGVVKGGAIAAPPKFGPLSPDAVAPRAPRLQGAWEGQQKQQPTQQPHQQQQPHQKHNTQQQAQQQQHIQQPRQQVQQQAHNCQQQTHIASSSNSPIVKTPSGHLARSAFSNPPRKGLTPAAAANAFFQPLPRYWPGVDSPQHQKEQQQGVRGSTNGFGAVPAAGAAATAVGGRGAGSFAGGSVQALPETPTTSRFGRFADPFVVGAGPVSGPGSGPSPNGTTPTSNIATSKSNIHDSGARTVSSSYVTSPAAPLTRNIKISSNRRSNIFANTPGPAIHLTEHSLAAWNAQLIYFYLAVRGFVSRHANEADGGDISVIGRSSLWPSMLAMHHPLTETEATSYLSIYLANDSAKACITTRVIVDYVVNRVWVPAAWTGADNKSTCELLEMQRELDSGHVRSSAARQHLLNQQAAIIGYIMAKESGTAWHMNKVAEVARALKATVQPLLNRFTSPSSTMVTANNNDSNINANSAQTISPSPGNKTGGSTAAQELEHIAQLAWDLSSKILASRLTFDFRFPDICARFSAQSMHPVWPCVDPAELQAKHWRVAFVATPAVNVRNDTGMGISAHAICLSDVLCMQ